MSEKSRNSLKLRPLNSQFTSHVMHSWKWWKLIIGQPKISYK